MLCYKDLSLLTKVTLPLIAVGSVLLFLSPVPAMAEQSVVSAGLSRLSGTDESSHIEYVRLSLEGTLLTPSGVALDTKAPSHVAPVQTDASETPSGPAGVSVSSSSPMLIAQCTRGTSGRLAFELLANFGGVANLAYYPPWRPASSRDLFPPQLQKPMMTMEFLGYTHVKPVKRQWEALLQPVGQYRYNPPSGGSSNMEDSTYYLRFLSALPTLRLTLANKAAEFQTTPLLDQIRKEPLCKASLL
jgi:hypothetical protein